MLHLVYRIKLSEAAEQNLSAFWAWAQAREQWFYEGLDTVLATQWRVRTIGEDVHTIEHTVTFADEAGWGRYRRQVSERGRDPRWERRRVEQSHWWTLLDAALLNDAPVPIGSARDTVQHQDGGADAPTDQKTAADRVWRLLDEARFATLATNDGTLPWASTVNFVVLRDPLRLLWYSLRGARHSHNIEARPDLSGAIHLTGLPGFGLDGLQFEGKARAVEDEQVERIHDLYYRLNFSDEAERREWTLPVDEFRGNGPRRFYIADISRMWLLDIDRWLRDKHDGRIEVPLRSLQRK